MEHIRLRSAHGKRSRGHIAQYRGKFRAVVSAGSDPLTGKRRQPKIPLFDTEKDAEGALTKMLNQVDGQRHPKSKILVSAFTDALPMTSLGLPSPVRRGQW